MSIRLSKALSELNIGLQTAVEFLEKRKDGDGEKFGPTSKLTDAQYSALVEAFKQDAAVRTEAEKLFQKKPKEKKHSSETKDSNNESLLASAGKQEYKPLGKIDLDSVGKPAAKQSGATKQDNTPQPKAAAVSQAKENKSEEKAPVAKTHAQHKTTEVKPAETAKAEKPATGTKEAHKSAKPAAEAKPTDIVIDAVRRDEVPGIHEITYDSDADAITICHNAHSRKGFALGAVLAAEYTKDHNGLLTTSDLFKF